MHIVYMAVRAASTSNQWQKSDNGLRRGTVLYSFAQFGRGEKVRSEKIFGIFWEACMRT
jgi:hypothetical protein